MRRAFGTAAVSIAEALYAVNRNSHRLNVLLTLNADQLARDGETAQHVLRRAMQAMRNLYRNRPMPFAGVWRYEVGTARYGGRHYHIAFHAPRGMRDGLLDALPRWFDEPMDTRRSSRSFRHAKWQARGAMGGWHIRRIYALDGALDYMAKVPCDRDGNPLSRTQRIAGGSERSREFATFGVPDKGGW